MKRFFLAVVLSLATVIVAGACKRMPSVGASGKSSAAATSKPAAGLRDWVADPEVVSAECGAVPLRILSAAPNVTEICCALGLRDQLVGRTRYCTYPPDMLDVPSIGALNDVDIERLLSLRPDLILVAGASRMQVERFSSLKLRFESVPDATLEDLFSAIRRIGDLTGRPRTAAALCRHIRGDLALIDRRYVKVAAARVLLVTGTLTDPPRPPYVAGPGSFYDDLLRRAGHTNVVPASRAAFAPLSLETIVRSDPDVIIELDPDGVKRPGGDTDALRVWAKLGRLRAVVTRRIHVLTGPEHYLLGPRIVRTYEALCHAIADNRND